MKNSIFVALLAVTLPLSAEPVAPAAPAAADAPNKEMLQQAFDGAMTCSALTAIRAGVVNADERWQWENRSFAFGMLAARFFFDATEEAMTGENLDKALNQYAAKLNDMEAHQLEPFETSCGSKYADIDKLCEVNSCPHAGPQGSKPKATSAPE